MQDLKQFFSFMNDIDFPYVVLRNFENLPGAVEVGPHSDLDLLVYDAEHWEEIFPDAERVLPAPRVRFKQPIGDSYIYIDVRAVEDGYYPEDFAHQILNTREFQEVGFWTPNPQVFRIALAYHAVHHKNHNSYKRWIGDASVKDLLVALKHSHIGWSQPDDPTVGMFNNYWKGATSVVEKKNGKVIKTQTHYNKWDLLGNEERILKSVDSIHFPKVHVIDEHAIEIEDCGDELTADKLPEDWKHQLVDILKELEKNGIQHRDIKPDNLMIKNGIIKLIDFGWSRLVNDNDDNPPKCLGHPYKPSWGFDDTFSMKKVIKELEFQRGEDENSRG